MNGTLFGKTVMLLGGSGFYGAAAARALGREGANVALGGRDRQKLEELEAEIRARGGEALVLGVHLAKRHHPAHLVEAAVETFGGLDALLFMASASAPPLRSLDIDAWERSLDVNARGFIYCLAAALPAMRERGGGRVVTVGVEDTGGARDPLLRAWRVAVRTILEELSHEFASDGICTAEVTLDTRWAQNPEEGAKAIVRALKEPVSSDGEPWSTPSSTGG
jgi:NAD(P)-dependent dehydrogenase (short-subunit alcohol dehydrogenase family)